MAKSILDIVIKLSKQGGADKETITGLVKVKSALLETAAVAGIFVAAGYTIKKVLDETVVKYVAYASEVRRASDATGMNTEETSRLIQVLDDVKIEYDQLEKVIQKNGKTYDYTTAGLARMSGEYLALSSATDRAAYMQDRFGKQWISFVPLMQLGGDAINKMSAGVAKSLVITEKASQEVMRYEMAQDNLNDAWNAFVYDVAPALMKIETDLLNQDNDLRRARELLAEQGLHWQLVSKEIMNAAIEEAKAEREAAEAARIHAAETSNATVAMSEGAREANDFARSQNEMRGASYSATTAINLLDQGFLQLVSDISQESLAAKQELQRITDEFSRGKITAGEYADEVKRLQAQLKAMDGARATAYINFVIQGGIPGQFDAPHGTQHQSGAIGDGYSENANGGPLSDVTMVGEKGYEMVVKGPNGQYTVIPHEASAWMIRAGLMPGQYAADGRAGPYIPPPPPPPARPHRARLPNTTSTALSPQDAASTAQAAQTNAQTAAAVTVAAQQQSMQNNQATAASMLGNQEATDELKKLNKQMRDFRSELATSVASAVQRAILTWQ